MERKTGGQRMSAAQRSRLFLLLHIENPVLNMNSKITVSRYLFLGHCPF